MNDTTTKINNKKKILLSIASMSYLASAVDKVETALTSGSEWEALLALVGIAASTLIPLTIIRNSYCFSVGYGASVLAMALTLSLAFRVPIAHLLVTSSAGDPPEYLLAQVMVFYGIRLTAFLAWREKRVARMRDQTESFAAHSLVRVLPLAVFLSALYVCMASPVLYALRRLASADKTTSTADAASWIIRVGVALAYLGLILESVSDQHKFEVKRRHKVAYGEKRFVGPTSGTYALCRHPNFLGEDLFWTGIWIGGVPSYGRNIGAWMISTFGVVCIVLIIKQSARRLDEKQEDWYGGQPAFEKWKTNVKGSLIPTVFA